ncbi:MAG: lipid A deacylase LpxR family protein [Pedobacter sp.]
MKKTNFILLVFFLLVTNYGYSQDYKNEFGFRSENDAYLAQGSDRYYTNGLFLNFRRALDQSKLKAGLEKKIYEISLGQKMYNPISGYAPDPARHDRPFAGYLYAGGALSWFKSNESVLRVSAEIGTVGPGSLAEDGQELLHNTVGFYELAGWEYQIRNEAAINLSVQYTKLIHRLVDNAADLSFEGYANVGTTFSGAGAGILLRAGSINQLFNSSYLNATVEHNAKTKGIVAREIFFYAKPQLNFVGYDATVQGSMFNNTSPVTFDVKPIVFAQQLGFNYSSKRFTFDFGVILQTKEIESTARAHQWGVISMNYRFN